MTAPLMLVTVTTGVTVGSYEIASVVKKGASGAKVKPVIAGFGMGVGLLVMFSINYSLGRNFCLLLIVSSLLINGPAVFNLFASKSTATTKGK